MSKPRKKWRKLMRWLEEVKWEIKWRLPPHRYHIINISGQDDYTVGWLDTDHKMMLACFKLLVDYVEKEKPFQIIAWEPQSEEDKNDPAMAEYWKTAAENRKEIEELYTWWKVWRPQEKRDLEAVAKEMPYGKGISYLDHPKWIWYNAAQDRFDRRDDEMLLRLIKIRKILWT